MIAILYCVQAIASAVRVVTAVCVACVCLLPPGKAFANEGEGKPEPIRVDAQLVEQFAGEFQAVANLGNIPIETLQSVRLVLHNAIGQGDVKLSTEPQASCSCVSLALSATDIPQGGTVVADVVLKVAAGQKTANWSQTISFAPTGGGSIVRIKLLGQVAGLLAVEPESFAVYVPPAGASSGRTDSLVMKELQVAMSPPHTVETLAISGPPVLDIAEIKLVKVTDTEAKLVIAVDPKDVPKDGLALPVTLTDKVTGRSATAIGTYVARDAISVLPSVVRMAPQENGTLKGTVILTRRAGPGDGPAGGGADALVAEAAIGEFKLLVTIAMLGQDAARATIVLPQDVAERLIEDRREKKDILPIVWDIIWGGARVQATTDIL